MEIYIASIVKRTSIEKKVYDEELKQEVSTVFMFTEEDYVEYCHDAETAEMRLERMMQEFYYDLEWTPSAYSFMYGNTEHYHSNFEYSSNGNRVDYFALIKCEELF